MTLFDAYRAVARTREVSQIGVDAISDARLAENRDGEDLLELAASRTFAIDVASLDLAVPQSLRSTKATSSASMAERRERVRALRAAQARSRNPRKKNKKKKKKEKKRARENCDEDKKKTIG